MTQRELVQLARQAVANPDDEHQCRRCKETMVVDSELEPTPLCNPCAQFAVSELAHAFLLTNRRKVKRG